MEKPNRHKKLSGTFHLSFNSTRNMYYSKWKGIVVHSLCEASCQLRTLHFCEWSRLTVHTASTSHKPCPNSAVIFLVNKSQMHCNLNGYINNLPGYWPLTRVNTYMWYSTPWLYCLAKIDRSPAISMTELSQLFICTALHHAKALLPLCLQSTNFDKLCTLAPLGKNLLL